MNNPEIREQVYAIFSQLLQRPDEQLRTMISKAEYCEFWRQVEESHGIIVPKSWYADKLPDLASWGRMWELTMGPVKPLAEPIESLYKPWTIDPSCEMTIANQKGWLKGDWACHMEELLNGLGFDIPPQFAHCPDHLVLELEFMSAIAAEAPPTMQIEFIEQHLDWLQDLVATAQERGVPQMYLDLYRWCGEYVRADRLALEQGQSH